MTESVVELASCEATDELGRKLARELAPGEVIFLVGELGAGKTTLVRSILQGMGWTGTVRSPSYALIHSYPALVPPVHHLDLYRIGSAEEALGLDLDQYLRTGDVLLVEWPDRLEGTIAPSLSIELSITGPQSRRARLNRSGHAYIDTSNTVQGAKPK